MATVIRHPAPYALHGARRTFLGDVPSGPGEPSPHSAANQLWPRGGDDGDGPMGPNGPQGEQGPTGTSYRAKKLTPGGISSGAAQTVTWGAVEFDTDSMDVHAQRLAAQHSGGYIAVANLELDDSAGGTRKLEIVVNAGGSESVLAVDERAGIDGTTLACAELVELDPDDYIFVRVTQATGGSLAAVGHMALYGSS